MVAILERGLNTIKRNGSDSQKEDPLGTWGTDGGANAGGEQRSRRNIPGVPVVRRAI